MHHVKNSCLFDILIISCLKVTKKAKSDLNTALATNYFFLFSFCFRICIDIPSTNKKNHWYQRVREQNEQKLILKLFRPTLKNRQTNCWKFLNKADSAPYWEPRKNSTKLEVVIKISCPLFFFPFLDWGSFTFSRLSLVLVVEF